VRQQRIHNAWALTDQSPQSRATFCIDLQNAVGKAQFQPSPIHQSPRHFGVFPHLFGEPLRSSPSVKRYVNEALRVLQKPITRVAFSCASRQDVGVAA